MLIRSPKHSMWCIICLSVIPPQWCPTPIIRQAARLNRHVCFLPSQLARRSPFSGVPSTLRQKMVSFQKVMGVEESGVINETPVQDGNAGGRIETRDSLSGEPASLPQEWEFHSLLKICVGQISWWWLAALLQSKDECISLSSQPWQHHSSYFSTAPSAHSFIHSCFWAVCS